MSTERDLDGVGGVLFSAEDKKANEKEEHKENAEGGSEGLVACAGKLVLDDFADCRVGTAAHECGNGVHGDGGNKYEESASGDAGSGERDNDARERAERACPEVVGGFDEGVIEFFNAGIDGENHKREIVVDEAQDDGEGGVHHREGGGQNVRGEKKAIHESFLAENGDPSVGTDEKAGPEGNHDKGEEEAAIGGASATDGVSGRISNKYADEGSE